MASLFIQPVAREDVRPTERNSVKRHFRGDVGKGPNNKVIAVGRGLNIRDIRGGDQSHQKTRMTAPSE